VLLATRQACGAVPLQEEHRGRAAIDPNCS
jgi:hypothetical protein